MALDTIIAFKKASIFQKENLILANVNLQLEKGELAYLIGKVGSGKSSLLKTIYAELPLQVGELKVGEFEISTLKRSKIPYLRRKIGIVFQDFQLLTDRSIQENLLFVLKATGWKKKKEMEQRILDVLGKVNLQDKLLKMPHELSGGEQQRVVIARALLNDPDIILADEPTGNLDPETSEEIMRLLIEISQTGRAVLIATHDYPLIEKFPSTIYKCDSGELKEVQSVGKIEEDQALQQFVVKDQEQSDAI